MGFAINNCPYSVWFEAVGASSDELIVRNGCKELFSAVVAGYDYIHDDPQTAKRFMRI